MVIRVALAAIAIGGCVGGPPSTVEGATGVLAREPICSLYRGDGFAALAFGDATLEVTLPRHPDLWGHELAFLAAEGDDGCRWDLGAGLVRAQYGGRDVSGWRALYLEGLLFSPRRVCSACDDTACRDFEGAAAERIYAWCNQP
jgi:hypothetical protein